MRRFLSFPILPILLGILFFLPSAQAQVTENAIGIYTEETGNWWANQWTGTGQFTTYLVLTNPVNLAWQGANPPIVRPMDSIYGFECQINIPPGLFKLTQTFPEQALNVGTEPDWIVGFASPLPVPENSNRAVVLLTISFLATNTTPYDLYLAPVSVPWSPGNMAIADGSLTDNNLQIAYPVTADYAVPVFGVNNSTGNSVTINTNSVFFDVPWTLSGPNSFTLAGVGSTTIPDLEPGQYTVTWGAVPGWAAPAVNPETKDLMSGNIEFTGYYRCTENAIGLYTDTSGTPGANQWSGTGIFDAYLVLNNPVNTAWPGASPPIVRPMDSVWGFECQIPIPSGLFKISSTFPAQALNTGTEPDWIVGFSSPQPVSADANRSVLLVTLQFLAVDTTPYEIFIAPTSVPSFFGEDPTPLAIVDGSLTDNNLQRAYPVTGDYNLPVFGVNTTWGSSASIDPNPDAINAPWTLEGPNAFYLTGNGDTLVGSLDSGQYTLTWGAVAGWATPAVNPVVQDLTVGTITFTGDYREYGSVNIDANPDLLNALWTLDGPNGYQLVGAGDTSVSSLEPGQYTLTWGAVQDWQAPSVNPMVGDLVLEGSVDFSGEYTTVPTLTSVLDVPNDQGRQVRLIWDRCGYDAPGFAYTITEYGVYRRQDTKSASGPGKLADWDFIGTVPARGDDVYQFVAPTLCDSTIVDGLCTSTFMVSAMTALPFEYFDSLPMTGYSVDNLNPIQASGFTVAFASDQNVLSWSVGPDTDVDHYLVYRETSPDGPGAVPLAQVAGTTWTDDLDGGSAWDYYYWVVAVDHAGNRSEPTDWASTAVSGVGGEALPTRVALGSAYPNPFNPTTTIKYELPREQSVRLSVYAIDGRLVARLVDEVRPAGVHRAVWTGQDADGRTVASGTYVYRLEAGEIRLQQTMTLLK